MTVVARDLFCLYPTPRGHVAALRGLTLEVAAGERVLVHGPNGSGKTTLLRVLAGEQPPSAGVVSVCGTDLVGASEADRGALRARRLGLVEQAHGRTLRPELTVRDNVALQLRLTGTPRSAARAAATDLLDGLGLGALAARRPSSLSGGEAQRVAVCAAVAHRPMLVLADEPTGELDRDSAEEVHDLLAAVTEASGAALVLVSHDTQAVRIAHRIVRIRDGRLSEEWRPGDAGHESLVVDDRGWVRLPEPLRAAAGLADRLRATVAGGTLVLTAATLSEPAALEPGPDAAPVAPPAGGLPAQPVPPAEPVAPPPGGAGVPAAAAGVGEVVATLAGITVDRARRRILDGQDLEVRAGELTVVRGRSGSGKTTMLRILTGLERSDGGTATVTGTDLSGLDRAGLAALRRHRIGVAGQGTALLEALDVTENLELARQVRGLPPDPDAVTAWVDALGLGPMRHRQVRVLSGGERQRVALARVLVVDPPVAVLDEPTSQQDEANAQRLADVLTAAARRGTAVVAASHDPILIAAADSVVTLT